MACVIQLCDVYRWHLNLWQVGLTAGNLFCWHAAVPVIASIEFLVRAFVIERYGKKPGEFFGRINLLESEGIIASTLAESLHALRTERNKVHLNAMERVQHDVEVGFALYNLSCVALRDIELALRQHA